MSEGYGQSSFIVTLWNPKVLQKSIETPFDSHMFQVSVDFLDMRFITI